MEWLPMSMIALSSIFSLAEASILRNPALACSSLVEHGANIGANIQSATLIPSGGLNVSNVLNNISFCQVVANVPYAPNDTLSFQLWLPDESIYQGRFMAVGGGGMAGTIDTTTMMQQLNEGFAVAGGDSGHLAADNNGGTGAPGVYLPYLHDVNQVRAWIHNAISILYQPSKSLVHQYYGSPARYSYYVGCSTGGAQGFALAQFHPELFDGIYAGSPGNWYSHLALSFLWNDLKTQNASYMSQELLNTITDAVLDKCDTIDGVADRVIENPLLCKFDIDTLACKVANTSACLTTEQLAAAKAIYAGPVSTLNGEQLYPGFSFGSEGGWVYQEELLADEFSIPILQNLVYDNLTYNPETFDFGADVADVDTRAGVLIDEISTDLSTFKRSGGKILVTQGWADQLNAAIWPIQHLNDIQRFFGSSDISDFFNLFMVPGGGHCGASENYIDIPSTYHVVDKLVEWVEKGEKPEYVLSTNPANPASPINSRRLCPWPKTAKLVPRGDPNSYTGFVCVG